MFGFVRMNDSKQQQQQLLVVAKTEATATAICGASVCLPLAGTVCGQVVPRRFLFGSLELRVKSTAGGRRVSTVEFLPGKWSMPAFVAELSRQQVLYRNDVFLSYYEHNIVTTVVACRIFSWYRYPLFLDSKLSIILL